MNDTVIHETRLSGHHNDGHFQLHTETAALLAESDAAELHIDDGLPQRHAAQLATLDNALKKIVKSLETKLIHEADKKRDESFRGLVGYVKAMCQHPDPSVRAAAERLLIVVETYGNVVNKSYEEETSAIYNLIQDLTSAKYAADSAAINLTAWITTLDADNKSVSAHLAARDIETAAKNHVNVKAARAAIDATYKKIVFRVNSHAGEDATPAIAEFVTKMNIIIKRFNTLLKQQQGHHHHHHAAQGGQSDAQEGGAEAET